MKGFIKAMWKGLIYHYQGNCCSIHLNQELCASCGKCMLCNAGQPNDCPVCS